MNTKLLMTSSSVILGVIGLGLSFIPNEIALYLVEDEKVISVLSFQII